MKRIAKYLGKLPSGTKVYRVPVRVQNDGHEEWYTVHASSVVAAANYIRDLYDTIPFTVVTAYGPHGGETERYIGSFTAIGNLVFRSHRLNRQLALL